MRCKFDKRHVSFTEECIQNEDYMGCLKGWRRYRLEYGFECACPEGVIYLPSNIDINLLEDYIKRLIYEYNP